MKVEVLYFEGCPNHTATLQLLRDVIEEFSLGARVQQVEVTDPDDAERLRFLGSPTVRVDGEDIEPDRRGDDGFAMSCRRYGESGIPPRALLIDALTRPDRS